MKGGEEGSTSGVEGKGCTYLSFYNLRNYKVIMVKFSVNIFIKMNAYKEKNYLYSKGDFEST